MVSFVCPYSVSYYMPSVPYAWCVDDRGFFHLLRVCMSWKSLLHTTSSSTFLNVNPQHEKLTWLLFPLVTISFYLLETIVYLEKNIHIHLWSTPVRFENLSALWYNKIIPLCSYLSEYWSTAAHSNFQWITVDVYICCRSAPCRMMRGLYQPWGRNRTIRCNLRPDKPLLHWTQVAHAVLKSLKNQSHCQRKLREKLFCP